MEHITDLLWLQNKITILKAYGYTPCFSIIFTKGENFWDSLPSLADKVLPNWGLLFNNEKGANSYSFYRVDTHRKKETKLKMTELLPLEVQRTLAIMPVFATNDFALKSNLLL